MGLLNPERRAEVVISLYESGQCDFMVSGYGMQVGPIEVQRMLAMALQHLQQIQAEQEGVTINESPHLFSPQGVPA